MRLTEHEEQRALADVRALRDELELLQAQRAAQRTSQRRPRR